MSRNIQGENVKLKTINLHLENQIDQLTNNWNELEEWVKKEIEFDKRWYNPESEEYVMQKHYPDDTIDGFIYVLDKMKEIKEGNNVSSRD